jgi:ligand-binding sensor domain-containing protein
MMQVKDLFADIVPLTTSKDSLDQFAVKKNGMLEDPAGRGMWFATRRGLHFFNGKTGNYNNFKNYPANALFSDHNYSALAKSLSGLLLVFDNDTKEIILFDPVTLKVMQRISLLQEMKDAYGIMLFEDSDGHLWFSTWKNGIVVIDRKNANRIERVQHNESNALSIAGDIMLDAMQDADGTIWCATTGGVLPL